MRFRVSNDLRNFSFEQDLIKAEPVKADRNPKVADQSLAQEFESLVRSWIGAKIDFGRLSTVYAFDSY
jgi:hypothetical protein